MESILLVPYHFSDISDIQLFDIQLSDVQFVLRQKLKVGDNYWGILQRGKF